LSEKRGEKLLKLGLKNFRKM